MSKAASVAGRPEKLTILNTLSYIYRENGIKGLYRGVTPRIGLGIWQTVCMVSFADYVKIWYVACILSSSQSSDSVLQDQGQVINYPAFIIAIFSDVWPHALDFLLEVSPSRFWICYPHTIVCILVSSLYILLCLFGTLFTNCGVVVVSRMCIRLSGNRSRVRARSALTVCAWGRSAGALIYSISRQQYAT